MSLRLLMVALAILDVPMGTAGLAMTDTEREKALEEALADHSGLIETRYDAMLAEAMFDAGVRYAEGGNDDGRLSRAEALGQLEAVGKELPCPHSSWCESCECAAEDDACFPDEAVRALKGENERLRVKINEALYLIDSEVDNATEASMNADRAASVLEAALSRPAAECVEGDAKKRNHDNSPAAVAEQGGEDKP